MLSVLVGCGTSTPTPIDFNQVNAEKCEWIFVSDGFIPTVGFFESTSNVRDELYAWCMASEPVGCDAEDK